MDPLYEAIKMDDAQFETFADEMSARVFWNGGVDFPWEGEALMDAEMFADMVRLVASAPTAARDAFFKKWGR